MRTITRIGTKPPELNSGDEYANVCNDFYGGDLEGLRKKLPYLSRLGVTVLYLNPIFRSRTNHKYDTGDYESIDPGFGTLEDFRALCRSAKRVGIRIVLDGVFSHVGSDSRYFNREGTYPDLGAYQSPKSPLLSLVRFPQISRRLRLLVGLQIHAQRARNGAFAL